MEKPVSLSRAIGGIWVSIALCALVSIAERLMGQLSPEAFLGDLVTYMAYGVLPCKISIGRNWARYLYAGLNAFGLALLLAGETPGAAKAEIVLAWVTLPVEVWITACLFSQKANAWFRP